MKFNKALLITALSIIGAAAGRAETTSSITGVVFADYYYNFNNSSPALKDQNAFNIRRVYFTYENSITTDLKVRFRLESENNAYGSTSKINPFVKHAYLEWSNLIPNHKLYLGIAETNAFKNSEEYWGYRSVEKTIMDLNKISSSADLGIALKGDLSAFAHHWLTFMNGTGYGASEGDRYKKIGYAFWITPTPCLLLEGYADYEKQNASDIQTVTQLSTAKNYALASSYSTLKGFIGYSKPTFTIGAEAFTKINDESGIQNATTAYDSTAKKYKITGSSLADVKKLGYSIFASWITPVPKLKVFGRYDMYDVNNDDDVVAAFDTAKGKLTSGVDDEYTLIIAGLDYVAAGAIHIMPNVMIKNYALESKKDDVTARITLFYNFNSGKIITQ